MQEIAYQSRVALPFTDRTPRLITLGVILLVGACGSGCLIATLPLAVWVTRQTGEAQLPIAQLLIAGLVYAALGTILGALGYGLVRRRRWARPLTMILAAHALVLGVVMAVSALIAIPLTVDTVQQGLAMRQTVGGGATPPQNPNWTLVILISVSIGGMLLAALALPLTYLLLLRHPDVRSTVEHYDPTVRWTDRIPATVLNMTVTLAVTAAFVGLWAGYGTVPLFKTIVRGPAAVALVLFVTTVLAVATWQVYRLRPAGWWLGVLTVVIATLLMLPSILLMPLADYYAAMGVDPAQLEPFLERPLFARASTIATLLLATGAFVVYMVRAKPAFDAAVRERSLARSPGTPGEG